MSLPKMPSDPNVEWHVLLRGERRGPYTPAGLRDLLETHPDGWSASVWRPGMLDWRPARQVEPLREAARGVAPPLPRDVVPVVRPSSARAPEGALRPAHEPPPSPTAELTPSDRGPPGSPPPNLPSLPNVSAQAAFILTPSEAEVALCAAQTRTRAAPLFAETTHEMPAYGPPRRSASRLYYLLAIGSLVLLSALLLFSKWRSTSASTRVPPPLAVATQSVAPQAPEPSVALRTPPPSLPTATPIAPLAPARVLVAPVEPPASTPAPHATTNQVEARESAREPDSERPYVSVTRVRVRARWAPVRAAADPSAKVLCSVPRGTLLSVSGQRPGTHARWFAVHCDAQTGGWVHENFLASVR